MLNIPQEQGYTELIAQYAAALGDNAVERYALFLSELPVISSLRERKETLLRAAEFGLDVPQVALSAADLCIERAFNVCAFLIVHKIFTNVLWPGLASTSEPLSFHILRSSQTFRPGACSHQRCRLARIPRVHLSPSCQTLQLCTSVPPV